MKTFNNAIQYRRLSVTWNARFFSFDFIRYFFIRDIIGLLHY